METRSAKRKRIMIARRDKSHRRTGDNQSIIETRSAKRKRLMIAMQDKYHRYKGEDQSIMETRSAKRKRLMIARQDKYHRYTGDDRISELSNDVLYHILSLLPTKTVAQMSVLSKRWRLIWTSYPDLDFSSTPFLVSSNKVNKFRSNPAVNLIDFLLHVVSHDRRSDIRALRVCAELSFTKLNRLIKQAVRLNVQELDLDVKTDDYFNLTRSVITCKSLRVLKLKSQTPGFRLPPSSTMKNGFEALHTLSLSEIFFDGQSSLLDLFTEDSFLHLKKLNLVSCLGLKKLRVTCREIVDLTLEKCLDLNSLIISCGKLEMLKVRYCFDRNDDHGSVEIDAPLVKIFVWQHNAIVESSFLEKITNLDEASIGFCGLDLLCGISYSRCVAMDSQYLRIMASRNYSTNIPPHSFDNLKKLEVHICLNQKQISTLASLLKNSPSIQILIISIDSDYKNERMELDEGTLELEFQALSTFVHNVKVVKITGCHEYVIVLCLAKLMLKYGIFLQEMILPLWSAKVSEKLKSQLIGFPWASSSANIIFRK